MNKQTEKIFEVLKQQNNLGKALLNGWKQSERIKDKVKREAIKVKLVNATAKFEEGNAALLKMVQKELNKKSKVVDIQLYKVYKYLIEG